jgi:hypothetical protein
LFSLRNLQRKAMNNQDRQLSVGFNYIKEMADRVHMPQIVIVSLVGI